MASTSTAMPAMARGHRSVARSRRATAREVSSSSPSRFERQLPSGRQPRRHHRVIPTAVPQDGEKNGGSSPDDTPPGIGASLLGGADLSQFDESADGDDVVQALGMRANLLGDEAEAKARKQAMANLGLLMASGQAGALNSISPDLLPLLLRLPSTSNNVDSLRRCADGIQEWKAQLARGLLPGAETEWPDDVVFREALLEALGDLDMARFTRQFPPVLDTLMKNILDVLYVYEQQKIDEGEEDEDTPPKMDSDESGGSGQDGEDGDPDEDSDPNGEGGGGQDGEGEEQDGDPSQGQGGGGQGESADGKKTAIDEIEMSMENGKEESKEEKRRKEEAREAAKAANKELVEQLMEDFKEQWEPAVDKLDKAAKAFEGLDLDDLADGPEGFDITKGLWQQTGWRELDSLRKKLEELRELRDLVRSLGRGSGRGEFLLTSIWAIRMTSCFVYRSASQSAAAARTPGHARRARALADGTGGDRGSFQERRPIPHVTQRDGVDRARHEACAFAPLCSAHGANFAFVRTRRLVGGASGDHGRHGDPPVRRVRPDHLVSGHIRVHDGRQGDGRQGHGAGVHATGEEPAARVLPVLVFRAGRLPGARAEGDGFGRQQVTGVSRR